MFSCVQVTREAILAIPSMRCPDTAPPTILRIQFRGCQQGLRGVLGERGMVAAPNTLTQLPALILMSERSSGNIPGRPSEEEVALAVSKEHKERRRTSGKASIARSAPLKVPAPRETQPGSAFRAAWRRTAGDLSEAEQRRAVEQALEVFRQLPPSSSYAQHRIRVLEKALQLLGKARFVGDTEEGRLDICIPLP